MHCGTGLFTPYLIEWRWAGELQRIRRRPQLMQIIAHPTDGMLMQVCLWVCYWAVSRGDGDFDVPIDYCTGCVRSRGSVTCSEGGTWTDWV